MNKNYLIVNTGSASKKYCFYQDSENKYSAHFEIEEGQLIVTESFAGQKEKKVIDKSEYPKTISMVIDSLIEKGIIEDAQHLHAIGLRIVVPGDYFLETKVIDDTYLAKAEANLEKVPLHLGPALVEIKNIKNIFKDTIKIIGISDSAFHKTIPEENRLYSIPIKTSRELGIFRFGYHGISVQSIVSKVQERLGTMPEKMVVCHLGGGGSISAVKNGKSINNSMGFTPLEGLTMATRVGDIDAGAVLYLSEKLNKNHQELETYFNSECGLLGLSGKSDDIRELITNEQNGDKDSSMALKVYVERVKENIAKMAANIGGIDVLVFAGTVGERSFIMRERICQGMEFLGIELDKEINDKSEGVETEINQANSRVKMLIVKTDENGEIAKEVLKFV